MRLKPLRPLAQVLLGTALCAQAAWADCPPPPDHSKALRDLQREVQAAPTEMAARQVSNRMWELWADAPDEVAQEMLDSGMRKRANFDLLGAIADFDRLVSYCPDYAEGYNQRAFALFIARDYARALPDLERAVGLSPDHTGARSGLALTLMQLGRLDEARAALRQALDRNPWLTERHLMEGDGPLAEPGEDI